MSGRLSGRVCVVTGTGGSMGRATAVTFASGRCADSSAATWRLSPRRRPLRLFGPPVARWLSLQPCRLSDPAECARLVELAVSEFGGIDVLFNLAARSHFHRLEDFTDEEWAAAQQDEIDLVFYLTRGAWPHLKASHGVVVNMASLNGSLSFKLLASLAHTTNKAAIIGMTRQLALEGSEHGIRVNLDLAGPSSRATRLEGSSTTRPGLARCSAGRSLVGSASRRRWRTSRCS